MNLSIIRAHLEQPIEWWLETVPMDAGQVPRRAVKICMLGLGKLDAVAAAVPMLMTDPDFGTLQILHPLTQTIFASLVSAGALTESDVSELNALGVVPAPRWRAMGLDREPDSADFAAAKHNN